MITVIFNTVNCPICKGKCIGNADYNGKPYTHHCEFCNNKGECHYTGPTGYDQLEIAALQYKVINYPGNLIG